MKKINNKTIIKAIDKKHLKQLIEEEIKLNGYNCDLNFIDISDITDISDLFSSLLSSFSEFNGDISQWNTSNVVNMSRIFYKSKFNGDISKWNTSNVKYMPAVFSHSKFNKDISKWDTSNVVTMNDMFSKSQFNGDISDWNIKKLEYLHNIFFLSKSTNIPYWTKIEDYNERIKLYDEHKIKKEKELILNSIKEKNNSIIKPNKNIIKI